MKDLDPRWLFPLIDQARERFYRGLVVACGAVALGLAACRFRSTLVLSTEPQIMLSKAFLVYLLSFVPGSAVLFYLRFRHFIRLRVRQAIFAVLLARCASDEG